MGLGGEAGKWLRASRVCALYSTWKRTASQDALPRLDVGLELSGLQPDLDRVLQVLDGSAQNDLGVLGSLCGHNDAKGTKRRIHGFSHRRRCVFSPALPQVLEPSSPQAPKPSSPA